MINGDSLIGEIGYNQMAVIPFPNDSNQFYLFCLAIFVQPGLYYSVINMTLDSGRGMVTQKNVSLINLEMFDGTDAIKNGNGRDWWVIFRPSNAQSGGQAINDFYLLQITPSGIQGPFLQNVGSLNSSDLGTIRFSHGGNKIAFVNARGMIELYDFDRCTDIISNPINIENENTPYPSYFGVEFSPNDLVLYISSSSQPSVIQQYDLTATNIAASVHTVASLNFPAYTGGLLRLAPDNKIYWSCIGPPGYPYPDTSTAYNLYNMNLSVINSPNLLGTACNFQPFNFYLGGKRTYFGLPNNPDYNLPAIGGSPCDTLGYPNHVQSISSQAENQLHIFYHPDWQTAFINASGLRGKNYGLHIVDITGKEVFSEGGSLSSQYYTKDLNCASFANGMYIVKLQTEKEVLSKKFVKE